MIYASINSNQLREHPPPPWETPGEFFEVVKSPAPGQNFPAKARPPGQKTRAPREYFRRSSQPFLLIGVEILRFCRNQTLKRIGRLSNYSLVIPSSFSLRAIFSKNHPTCDSRVFRISSYFNQLKIKVILESGRNFSFIKHFVEFWGRSRDNSSFSRNANSVHKLYFESPLSLLEFLFRVQVTSTAISYSS